MQNTSSNPYIVLDLETTGLAKTSRIVSIAWIVLNSKFNDVERRYYVVKPAPGTIIPTPSVKVHGITTVRAKREGIALRDVCYVLARTLTEHKCDTIVTHNANFDVPILLNEVRRVSQRALARKLSELRVVCTMKKGAVSMGVTKWPKLINLYKHLFDVDISQEQQHHALYDCVNCAQIFKKLTQQEEKQQSEALI